MSGSIITGIGSRSIKSPYTKWMADIAVYLAKEGCTLRSGGASGSDTIFAEIFKHYDAPVEIFIPWDNFQGLRADGKTIIVANHKLCTPYTEKYHPNHHNLSEGARKLINRNAHQVLGKDLNTPSDLVVCYTDRGNIQGGTAQAIKIAADINIPVVNLGLYNDYELLFRDVCKALHKEN